ncbi:MAG TPA: LPS assembly protein LptD, partial [Acidobacteriaceae bacterium]|nr:LPS assembly protein LptD [Acidobacteriaceae bacterium]
MTTKTLPDRVTQTPDVPDLSTIPLAVPVPPANPDHVVWECDTESRHGDVYLLSGDVEITFGSRHLRADTVRLDNSTGEVEAQGHLRLTDSANDESLDASHATYNLRTGTGRFFDAAGSVGMHREVAASPTARIGLENSNPFLFTGRVVEKTGPENYTVYDGTVTSCQLPHPDWLFSSHRLAVSGGKVSSRNATFHLLGLPILFFPYLNAPVSGEQRQSGLLIPELPSQSTTKGIMTGEQVYFTLGRSADVTAGVQYFSQRGFAESGTLRYRGNGLDFGAAHFSALQDRGYYSTPTTYVQQGGQDVTAAFRRQIAPNIRLVGDGEYLSSYIYREAFTGNFNQAVSSDITSVGFLTRQTNGWSVDARVDRYQGLKQVPLNGSLGEQVHILHAPSFDLDGVDRRIAGTPLLWTVNASVAGLKRAQPNFTSSGIIERVDVRPELSLPLHFDGWNLRASLATRETFYSRSRQTPYPAGVPPIELTAPVNRADVEMEVALRPPAVERDFTVPGRLQKLFGTDVRHTVEPELTYRNVRGVDNFLSILRFDDADLVSDTDELEYGLTQHLYFRPKTRPQARTPPGCPTVAEMAHNPAGPDAVEQTTEGLQVPVDETVPDVLSPSPADST